MDTVTLEATARALVGPHRGILASDESTGTIGKRFEQISIESTCDSRRAWRGMLFTAPGMADNISGVILYDETLRQSTDDGTPFPELMRAHNVVPGIKVDTGVKAHAGFPGELVTEGLDGLRERLAEYRELGAGFAKWRAVITITEGTPTDGNIAANAHALARYAALCQEVGIVPIVEPEVLMSGDHTIEMCREATTRVLHAVYAQLAEQVVHLPGTLLKPNMAISGSSCPVQADPETVAQETVAMLLDTVPAEVPGIVFLSGGQSDEVATHHLSEMNRLHSDLPWELSYSYGRALQHAALMAWGGQESHVAAAQAVFLKRCRLNGLARAGSYRLEMEQDGISA